MQTQTAEAPQPTLTLEDLEALDSKALAGLYANGRVTKISALDGDPQGRMLAVRGLDHGRAFSFVHGLSTAAWFPWGGKSFAGDAKKGTGANRVHLGGRHQLFPFLTLIGPSAVDGKDTIILDYDLPDNPALIRAIHDEVREVSPGLYLGPAMWKTAKGKAHVLWFALDTTRQAKAIGTK